MSWANNYIARLQSGETITFNAPNGNSMRPKIVPKQSVTLAPVTDDTKLSKDDIVLCKVHGSQYLHLISAVKGEQFQISNNHGHVNGTINRTSIYGKLI
jgi:hypothetical protein